MSSGWRLTIYRSRMVYSLDIRCMNNSTTCNLHLIRCTYTLRPSEIVTSGRPFLYHVCTLYTAVLILDIDIDVFSITASRKQQH